MKKIPIFQIISDSIPLYKAYFVIVSIFATISIVVGVVQLLSSGVGDPVIEMWSEEQSEIVVGSRRGSTYHFPWCGGAGAIKEENRMEFSTILLAKEAGYRKAKNCKGLK